MNIPSISLSYFFIGISIVAFIFFFYFKYVVTNTDADSKKRDKIIGSMKDPDHWRARNNIMSFISLFWAIISLIAFIYLKFFFNSGLVSIIYVFVYLALIAISAFIFLKQNKVIRSK